MRSPLSICIFYSSDTLAQALSQYLSSTPPGETVGGRYLLAQFNSMAAFLEFLEQGAHQIDCLILQESDEAQSLLERLRQQEAFFPAVILRASPNAEDDDLVKRVASASTRASMPMSAYHPAVLKLPMNQLHQIGFAVDQAISQFVQLSLSEQSPEPFTFNALELPITQHTLSLRAQQLRLAEKLKERLGYLGVYYKRNPQNFLRYMTQPQREELLRQLKEEYCRIILSYFSDETSLNQKIDNFVNTAFFADVPVSQIVEIHMDLMDEFSKQLKLEGRSEDILQDYRLTLIDTLAHLCEMYRRSIPRES